MLYKGDNQSIETNVYNEAQDNHYYDSLYISQTLQYHNKPHIGTNIVVDRYIPNIITSDMA